MLAKEGIANIELPETHFENLDFSFSGIKTAVLNLHHKNPEINKVNLCASFEKATTDVLIENTLKALNDINSKMVSNAKKNEHKYINQIVLAGGVSANSYIRARFEKLKEKGIKVYFPELKLCTDNAAMIASAGYYNFMKNKIAGLDLNAIPNLKL